MDETKRALATIDSELRKWIRDFVHKEVVNEDTHGGGRRNKLITNHKNYNILEMWEKAILFKYKSYLDSQNIIFSSDTWKKWKSRILRNWDDTNMLLLECITKLQTGDILYSEGVAFVSF